MKLFCRYSGITLHNDTILDNLGLKKSKLLAVGEHPVFNRRYDIFEVLSMATFKPAPAMSTDQRRLLFVAMLRHTELVKLDWPVNVECLPNDRIQVLFPHMVDILIRIASHLGYWRDILPAMPRIHLRSDNWQEVNLPGYIAELKERTQTLLLPPSLRGTKKSHAELLGDEIDLEWQLKQQILKYRSDKKKSAFTVNIGKYVLNELDKQLRAVGKSLSEDNKAKAVYIFSTAKEKIKYGPEPIEKLRELIVTHVQVGIDSGDTLLRNYTALTIGYLDNCLDYANSITNLFGGSTILVPAKLPRAFPVQYSVHKAVSAPAFPESRLAVVPKNTNLEATAKTNPLLAKILAKKAQENQGASNV